MQIHSLFPMVQVYLGLYLRLPFSHYILLILLLLLLFFCLSCSCSPFNPMNHLLFSCRIICATVGCCCCYCGSIFDKQTKAMTPSKVKNILLSCMAATCVYIYGWTKQSDIVSAFLPFICCDDNCTQRKREKLNNCRKKVIFYYVLLNSKNIFL